MNPVTTTTLSYSSGRKIISSHCTRRWFEREQVRCRVCVCTCCSLLLSLSLSRARALSLLRARALSPSGVSLACALNSPPPSSYPAVSPSPSEFLSPPHPSFFFNPLAVPSFQRHPSSVREWEGKEIVPTNLHRVDLLAREKYGCASKAHRVSGKTRQRQCERSFGTNVLLLGKPRDDLLTADFS